MAKIANGVLKNWSDGETVKAFDYKQEREILKTAINATDDEVSTLKKDLDNLGGIPERTTNLEKKTENISQDGADYTGKWFGKTPSDLYEIIKIEPSLLVSPGMKIFEFHVNDDGAIVTTEIVEGFSGTAKERLQMKSQDNKLWEITIDDDGLLVTKEVI